MCISNTKTNLDIIVIFSAISISFIIAAVCFLIVGVNEPNFHKIKCNELNCTVNSVDGHCYAKLAQMIGYDFQEVKCDKPRGNEMYFVLPCNVGKGGKIDINCDMKNDGKSNNITSSIVLLLCGVVIGFAAITLGFRLMMALNVTNATNSTNTVENSATPDSSAVGNNQTGDTADTLHEKNTGSNYIRFDKD